MCSSRSSATQVSLSEPYAVNTKTQAADGSNPVGTLEAMLPIGIKPVSIKLDKEGMCPTHLDEVLSSWSTEQGPKPKLVIVVPTGKSSWIVRSTLDRF